MNNEHATRKPAPPWTVWLPSWLVALSAIAATAHGLFEVVRASMVPAGLAWLYPVITDGLALLAYAAAEQLTSKAGRAYAWMVVVIAAGLSGLAQAAFLAGGVGQASPALRFGVGAWPAIAAAVVAHLLFLLATERRTRRAAAAATDASVSASPAKPSTAEPRTSAAAAATHRVDAPVVQRPTEGPVQPPSVQSAAVQRGGVQPGAVQSSGVQRAGVQDPDPARRVQDSGVQRESAARGGSGSRALPAPATTTATEAARRWFAEQGRWPSVRELKNATGVSQGTCGTVLNDLKAQPAHLHLVNTTDETTQTRNQA